MLNPLAYHNPHQRAVQPTYPAKQYEHFPFSCARCTARTPDGTSVNPGIIPFANSAFACSAGTPTCAPSMPLMTVWAMLQTTNVTPRGCSLSTDIVGNIRSPCCGLKKMFLSDGALVFGSLTFANAPSLYFAQISSVYAIGIEK